MIKLINIIYNNNSKINQYQNQNILMNNYKNKLNNNKNSIKFKYKIYNNKWNIKKIIINN